eukprot:8221266-Pyramimonas_sp.AAC.1
MIIRPPWPETASQLWVPRLPELTWRGHFRPMHLSRVGNALPHGGPTTVASEILATLGSEASPLR